VADARGALPRAVLTLEELLLGTSGRHTPQRSLTPTLSVQSLVGQRSWWGSPLRSRRVSSASKYLDASDQGGQTAPLRPGGLTAPPGLLNRPGWPHLLVESSASVLWLNRVTQWFSGEPLQTPRARCSLRQSPLMTRLPRSPSSNLFLRLNQETVHDFVPLFLPPCGPHLTPLDTGSLEPSLLVFSTPGGLTGDDLSRLLFTCTNTSQAATCTCNT
jgi:hypothetical protein